MTIKFPDLNEILERAEEGEHTAEEAYKILVGEEKEKLTLYDLERVKRFFVDLEDFCERVQMELRGKVPRKGASAREAVRSWMSWMEKLEGFICRFCKHGDKSEHQQPCPDCMFADHCANLFELKEV